MAARARQGGLRPSASARTAGNGPPAAVEARAPHRSARRGRQAASQHAKPAAGRLHQADPAFPAPRFRAVMPVAPARGPLARHGRASRTDHGTAANPPLPPTMARRSDRFPVDPRLRAPCFELSAATPAACPGSTMEVSNANPGVERLSQCTKLLIIRYRAAPGAITLFPSALRLQEILLLRFSSKASSGSSTARGRQAASEVPSVPVNFAGRDGCIGSKQNLARRFQSATSRGVPKKAETTIVPVPPEIPVGSMKRDERRRNRRMMEHGRMKTRLLLAVLLGLSSVNIGCQITITCRPCPWGKHEGATVPSAACMPGEPADGPMTPMGESAAMRLVPWPNQYPPGGGAPLTGTVADSATAPESVPLEATPADLPPPRPVLPEHPTSPSGERSDPKQ